MRPFNPHADPKDFVLPDEIPTGDQATCILYRFYNAQRQLLYVGITTGHPRQRWRGHQRHSVWWKEAAFVVISPQPSRQAARRAEVTAIQSETPIHNRVGRKGWYPGSDGPEHPRRRPAKEPAQGKRIEIPISQARMDFSSMVKRAANGQIIYLTKHGKVLAALISAEDAERLELEEKYAELVQKRARIKLRIAELERQCAELGIDTRGIGAVTTPGSGPAVAE